MDPDSTNKSASIEPPAQPQTQTSSPPSSTSTSFVSPVPPPPAQGSNKFLPLLILVVVLLVIGGGSFYFMSKSNTPHRGDASSNPLQKMIAKSPYDSLRTALDKTIAVKTAYVEYKTKVTSSVTSAQSGVTQTLHNSVDGSISGSTDGKTQSLEMKIYNDDYPDKSVNISTLTTELGEWYIRNAQTAPKWQKLTKEQYDAFSSGPTDASLYGLVFMGTFFSPSQALFNSFNKEAVVSLGEERGENTTYSKYKVDVSTPAFIEALSKDENIKPDDVADAKQILQDAIITVTYYVDDTSGYVTRLVVDAKRLTQIQTPEALKLGLSTTHDINLEATLSRFDIPTNITAPGQEFVLGVSTRRLIRPSLPLR